MPFVEISNSNGPARVNYTISTPTNPSAPSIDPSLPTLFFIHPVYIPQQIFHRESLEARYLNDMDGGTNFLLHSLFCSAVQFSNASLRRFNLVAMDSRLHGDTVGPVPKDYNRTDAARDIASVMVGDLPFLSIMFELHCTQTSPAVSNRTHYNFHHVI